MTVHEPVLNPIPIGDLRPTQVTVGLREVAEKQRRWREKSDAGELTYLGRHLIPVVRGPKGRPYVLDHHHLCRALLEAGQTEVLVNEIADLSRLAKDEFWMFLDARSWCHPYDVRGERLDFKDIPKSIAALTDDPFRSLVGALHRAGGLSKDAAPFGEFVWADFLRRRIQRQLVEDHFAAALTEALKLAKSDDADHLPGWCGPSDEG